MPLKEELASRLDDLDRARAELERVRDLFRSEPELLRLYEPSARYVADKLAEDVWRFLINEWNLTPPSDAWITLRGVEEDARLHSSVVAKYLNRLVVANQHAVSILENSSYRGGRFRSDIRAIADFEIVAVLPGSARIGLKAPTSLDVAEQVVQGELFSDEAEVLRRRDRALAGLRLLVQVFRAVDSPDLLKQLEDRFQTRRLLELLRYAKQLTPTARSPYRSVEFSGKVLQDELQEPQPICVTAATHERVDETVTRLSESQQYAEERGIVREVDLDRKKMILRRISASAAGLRELPCDLPPELPEADAEQLLNKPVAVTGWLIFSSPHGQPSRMEVESVSVMGEDENDDAV
ncbi:hypothetical protein LIP_0521 [Limnochorda pilosa]|uniref:Uncharacterized protein n=1 Tax=Limnochorda pilosa TaxID=1555112 RepID=A0A0K2SGZ0_LIMPI|nr:hypothetical protein LIP_0521 [Limnochorda pilosa]